MSKPPGDRGVTMVQSSCARTPKSFTWTADRVTLSRAARGPYTGGEDIPSSGDSYEADSDP